MEMPVDIANIVAVFTVMPSLGAYLLHIMDFLGQIFMISQVI